MILHERWMSLCLLLAAHGCFDPTDLDVEDGDGGPTTSEVGSDTNPSASEGLTEGDSVTLTEASETAGESESDTQPTATSVDASTKLKVVPGQDSTARCASSRSLDRHSETNGVAMSRPSTTVERSAIARRSPWIAGLTTGP